MRLKLLSLFAHNDDGTRRAIEKREQEAKETRALNRLRRAEIVDNLFASMMTDPPQEPGK